MKQLAVLLVFLLPVALVIGAHWVIDQFANSDPNLPPPEQVRESVNAPLSADRSDKWPAVRRAHLGEHPACEACGASIALNVHHVIPFHERPDLELEESNLITLCAKFEDVDSDGTNDQFNCHFRIGHDPDGPDGPRGPNWKLSNPNVWQDARMYRDRTELAP